MNNHNKPNDQISVIGVLPVIGQPRHAKRISMLQEAGFGVEAIAFERQYHSGRLPNCQVEKLATLAHGKYFSRIPKMLSVLPQLRRAIRRNQLVYTFGPDMAFMALLASIGLKRRPLILEVGDLRKIQVSSGIKGTLMRAIDKWTAKSCGLLVVTARDFAEGYYRRRLNIKTPVLVLENKIEPSSELSHLVNARPADDGPSRKLRIGYFGLLRCQWSWQVLEALAKKQPDQIEIKVAGHPLCPINIEERAKQFQNITFLGTYQSPAGLPALYDDVDLVWACYPGPDVDDNDMRWAQLVCRSNRFYESCFFQRPTITVAGSGDAKEVQRYDLGFIVHDQRIESVVESILKIQPKQLEKWQANLRELPRHVFEYSNEIEQLREAVAQLINPKLIIASSGEPIGTNPERQMKSPTSDC